MQGGAVVALHVVLDDELPIGSYVVVDPATHDQTIESVAIDHGWIAEPVSDLLDDRLLEVRRRSGEAYPNVTQPLTDPRRYEAALDRVEVRHIPYVGRTGQPPVQRVAPGVVGALERSRHAATLLPAEPGATVPTDIQERAYGLVVPAHQDHALASGLKRLEAPWSLEIGSPRGAKPPTSEDPFLLESIDAVVPVVVAWQGRKQCRFSGRGHHEVTSNQCLCRPVHAPSPEHGRSRRR